MSRLIGLSGFAQSGKDTVGGFMEGFTRLAFADALKSVLYAMDPIAQVVHKSAGNRQPALWRVQTLADELGWEEAKTRGEVRPFLQKLGVAVRDFVDPDAWVNAVLRQVEEDGSYVITDVRFPNEYDAIMARGGEVWRIERPGIVAPNDHISETALRGYGFDQVVENNGTLDDLKHQVTELLGVAVT